MIVPCRITREDAGRFVYQHHRTHDADQGDRFVVGAWDLRREVLCGVAVVGNPRAPALTALGTVVEVTRCCTDGTRNACSWLYTQSADHARIDGWAAIITYTLKQEGGASLRAAGWWGESLKPRSPDGWANREGRASGAVTADRRWLKLLNEHFRAVSSLPAVVSPQLALIEATR